ncbi:sugar-binding transcriptional regulator [Candidatus Poriferisodalis sp.]|uniref:sugar-binding transcriptional regulator n=1 Tax=Candidatus Poriferisodalis sp. TaxID=3101277 RepID=UPI003B013B2D
MASLDPRNHMLLAQVAHLYFEDQLTQSNIAQQLDISRIKVHRLLKEARDRGIVHIAVKWPHTRDADLEARLSEVFELREAVVVSSDGSGETAAVSRLGLAGARILEQSLLPGQTMAVCLGRATRAVIDAVQPGGVSGINVVQAIGNRPLPDRDYDASALAGQLAEKFAGEVVFLRAPPLADNPEAAALIAEQRDISSSLEAARSAHLALVGVGSLDLESSAMFRSGAVTAEELADARRCGAVGDLAWRLIDQRGDSVDCDLTDRVIGVSLHDLRAIPTTLAVAAGPAKVRPLRAVLRTKAIDILCTDVPTAQAVLGHSQ